MTSTTRRAAIYIRVSSEEQVQGYSLDAQERAGRMYCEMHGWEVVSLYRDEGRSARTEQIAKRPAFAGMLKDARPVSSMWSSSTNSIALPGILS